MAAALVGTVADGDSMSTEVWPDGDECGEPPSADTGNESRRCRWTRDADAGSDLCTTTGAAAAAARGVGETRWWWRSPAPADARPAGTVDDPVSRLVVHGDPSANSAELGRRRRAGSAVLADSPTGRCCARSKAHVCRRCARNTSATEPSQKPRRYASSTRFVSLTCCRRADGLTTP